MQKEILGKECKFIFWLPAIPDVREDTHVIKEVIHYKDGTKENNLKVLSNFKRPFWITKPHLQQHKDKKESEYIENLNKYTSTQSELGKNVAMRLGNRYIGKTSLRDVQDSPFVYGLDVDSKVTIKKLYLDKYPDTISEYKEAALDIEINIETGEITVISLTMKDKIYTVFTKKFIQSRQGVVSQLEYLFTKYIPKTSITENIKTEYHTFENELECVLEVLKKAHEWQPDIIAIWNITFDIGMILDVLEKHNIDPKDVFSDPRLPKELRHFKFKMGSISKMTDSGKFKPISPEEQWHVIDCPATFYWVDAMSAHRYVRVGGKTVPGGYSLDNILKKELGDKLGKLKFKEELGQAKIVLHYTTTVPLDVKTYTKIERVKCPECGKDIHVKYEYDDYGTLLTNKECVCECGFTNEDDIQLESYETNYSYQVIEKKGMHLGGIDWHRYMSANKPLEYIIYNQWDVISMLHLDEKTKDLSHVMAMLSGVSSFDIFNSGPKKIIDAMHFFYLERGRVLGSKPKSLDSDVSLGLDNWIVLLPSSRIKENGMKVVEENPNLVTNVRGFVFDADQVSGYPSDTQAANVSKETTVREVIDIKGIDKDDFKLQNINLMFGKVNSIDYCTSMFNFPTLEELSQKANEELKATS
jgi:hypothetical protein